MFELFQVTFITSYATSSVTSDEVDSGYYPPQMTSYEVDSGYHPPQMERCDWSDSFVYVTMKVHISVAIIEGQGALLRQRK